MKHPAHSIDLMHGELTLQLRELLATLICDRRARA